MTARIGVFFVRITWIDPDTISPTAGSPGRWYGTQRHVPDFHYGSKE